MVSIITIDGPSGAGKSTVSLGLANLLGYTYVDSGALYRIVALEALRKKIAEENENALVNLCKNLEVTFRTAKGKIKILNHGLDVSEYIRSPEISMLASRLSAKKAVRDQITALQRKMGEKGKLVLEGRDAGTVVFPEAEVKFFLDATPEERGKRRFKELTLQGLSTSLEQVTQDIITRDHNDSTRSHAPLKPAPDAVIINSSAMTVNEVIARMMAIIQAKKKLGGKNEWIKVKR
ncbi:MAG TPA: (d)CMP kinase [Thermodesulfobacteriota bacterium]|nr:(d)CMP kinase [Thermodesulfobacteriota bacterium]